MTQWSVLAALAACGLAVLGALITPPPGIGAAVALAGWPRFGLYALAGVLLGGTGCVDAVARLRLLPIRRRAVGLVLLGLLASLTVAAINVVRLSRDIADPWGPALWLGSMVLLLGYVLFPLSRRIGWASLWASASTSATARRSGVLIALGLVVLAAALRLPALGAIPGGINADEGDRAATAFDVLSNQAPASWFDSGWFYINMVYFRLLAVSLALFGPDIAGGRMLSALCGIAFVAAIGWCGCRNFGWRVGLVATALAAAMDMNIQHSRFLSEAAPTALLWAISIGGFLEGTRTGRPWAWALAGLCGGLSLYFYPSARLWAAGAVLTVGLLWLQLRNRRLLAGGVIAAIATLVAAGPFLVHLSQFRDEATGRYLQTTVLDPLNQSRLEYLTPPEPWPLLAALQGERTLGLFDRYPDGGGFLPRPTTQPLFGQPLAALTLVGAVYALVRGWRDPRLAVISIWFWLGLSGVALTVESPDYLRAVGMLPSLCFIVAVPLVDLIDRFSMVVSPKIVVRHTLLAGAAPALVTAVLALQEVTSYFNSFATMPAGWGPATREGQAVASLGTLGPVYSLEMNEHAVSSGWVRLLAPHALRGRLPNPGRELPILGLPPTVVQGRTDLRPDVVPGPDQGLSVLLSNDPNQRPYLELLRQLYPDNTLTDVGDGRRAFQVAAGGLAATRGAMLFGAGGGARAVDGPGDVPPDVALPASLTWRSGVLLSRGGGYAFSVTAPGQVQLRLDGVTVIDGSNAAGPLQATAVVARGLHFLELTADISRPAQRVSLTLFDPDGSTRPLNAAETFRPMDSPWGLLLRKAQSVTPNGLADAVLDATVAMAFFNPELGYVPVPNTLTWSGTLIAPRAGTYRMAFAAEDQMHLRVDGQLVDVVSLRPEQWQAAAVGSQLRLAEGPHQVEVTLDVTHGGRELARWNWVPPQADGAVDAAAEWAVVPPRALRPDQPVTVAPSAGR
ncbi:MAG TPA: PA14 domain-containing protein [Chloroflexota bacterium]|nr:PA14 domain-containing protein [Chloroflexota bacterium]